MGLLILQSPYILRAGGQVLGGTDTRNMISTHISDSFLVAIKWSQASCMTSALLLQSPSARSQAPGKPFILWWQRARWSCQVTVGEESFLETESQCSVLNDSSCTLGHVNVKQLTISWCLIC